MRTNISFLAVLFIILSSLSYADFPIRQSNNWEGSSSIAYNSTDHEYLVVWSEYVKMGSFYITGPIMGQRVSENGNPIGGAFTIFNTGSLPHVAYNPHRNEYLVVSATLGSIYGQRIDNSGNLIEDSIELDWEDVGNWSKVVYNPLTEDYLLVLAALQENPQGSGFYNIKIFGKRVSSLGQPMGLGWLIEDVPYGTNEYGLSRFAIAYAPIQSAETPKGRYLLAVQTNSGINLTMLNQWGYPLDVVYDPQSQQYFRYIPFHEGSVVGGELNVDVAYGMKAGYNLPGPAFFVVWGDNNNTWDGQEWTGIYGSFINSYKLDYLTTDPVQDNSFPISAIYDHYAFGTDEYAKSWKPKAAYNNAGQKFMVTWRETPTTNSQNDTKVNHIRADKEYTGGSYYTPNDVISAVTGNENPMEPSIASSTINPTALITWNDYRNFSTTDWDVYGNLYTIPSVPSITVTKPNGGESWFVNKQYEITWTSSNYSNPVRIEYSTDGGASYIEIVNSTSNDGSYLWTVPFTLSDYSVVKISDATDSDPFDISDRVSKITTTKKIVLNTNDSGYGSLRQAILDANNAAGFDTIIFKIPGTGIHTIQPLTQLPEIVDPVLIDGFSQPGSSANTNPISQGCNAYLNIELDGTNAGIADGLIISCGGSIVRGLILNNFSIGNGILLKDLGNNIIEGNFIGTNYNAINIADNNYGVRVLSDANIIGGTIESSRNIISGNEVAGISLEGNSNLVQGNFIGTDITGLNPLENQNGVLIYNKYIAVIGNRIGGTSVSARNIISGNQRGIVLASGVNTVIEGNFIGTDISGTSSLANTDQGIHLLGDSLNLIGGNVPGSANVISGNIGNGLLIESANSNTIEGNFIGLQLNGVSPLGNSKSGIMVNRGNASDAVCLGNRIIGNSINYNDSLGINLDGGNESVYDVTGNDLSDTDTGPNNLQNYPVLTKVEVDIATFVTGSLNSTANTTFRIDFYSSPVGDPSGYGEGQTHISWTEVTTDVNGNVDFNTSIGTIVPPGHVITSTATDPYGNTSEFSNWIATPAPKTYTVSNTNNSGQGSLRQAIIDANINQGLDSIAFNIPGTGPFKIQPNVELPAITDPVIIDGYSQPGSHPNTNSISKGNNAVIVLELDGSAIAEEYKHGLYITSSSTIRGLAINRFKMGITIEPGLNKNDNCRIEGNYIGTDVFGSVKLNNEHGIHINSVNNNLIGGSTPESHNLISGNSVGVWILSSQNNHIIGNLIGTDATGKFNLGNDWGIEMTYSKYCTIGSSLDSLGNCISGNLNYGISLDQASYNSLQNNIIGLDVTGNTEISNSAGIVLQYGSSTNYIMNNKIGGNSTNGIGINIGSNNNLIIYNLIGTDESWQFDFGNHGNGIALANGSEYNMIENNFIGFNDQWGICIDTSLFNSLSQNLISKNGDKGIKNVHGGNKDVFPPTIVTVNSTEVTGLSSSGYRVEIFSDDEDEGRYYLGAATADGSGNFTFTLTEPVPLKHITATCTDSEGNTSEFSAPFVVTDVEKEKNKLPTNYFLYQNHPNPFNSSTIIKYFIPSNLPDGKGGVQGETSKVTLKVYDVLGNEVAVLVDNELNSGYHSIDFNAANLPSGVYFCRLTVREFSSTIRMILIK